LIRGKNTPINSKSEIPALPVGSSRIIIHRHENLLRNRAPHPLLARIHEFYQDAHFDAEEVPTLEAELNRVRELPMDDRAQNFLNGMLKGCELAKTERLGIRLLSS
jgi:hypothetical protein